jgi:anti-sigma factor RsiW
MTAMTMPLNCDEFAWKLADYLDGDLSDAVRGAMEAHAASCAECSRLLSEIESLRIDAASLPRLEPSGDLWAGIAERIDARVLPLDAPRTARVAPMRRVWRHPAVAAAALVLVTAGITHVWTRASYEAPALPAGSPVAVATPVRADRADSTAVATSTTPAGTVATTTVASREPTTGSRAGRSTERATPRAESSRAAGQPAAVLVSRSPSAGRIMKTEVEPVYDREILKLRAIMRERRGQLDPRTIAVLEQSIAVIDSAIAQSRAALAKDPASGFLATQLNHSLEKKVELLRTAALLPART